jgi:hypothetical protein
MIPAARSRRERMLAGELYDAALERPPADARVVGNPVRIRSRS